MPATALVHDELDRMVESIRRTAANQGNQTPLRMSKTPPQIQLATPTRGLIAVSALAVSTVALYAGEPRTALLCAPFAAAACLAEIAGYAAIGRARLALEAGDWAGSLIAARSAGAMAPIGWLLATLGVLNVWAPNGHPSPATSARHFWLCNAV